MADDSDHPEYCPECSAKHWSEAPSVGWYCKSCGYEPEGDENETDEPIRCNHCGNPNIVGATEVIPVSELEQLADEFIKQRTGNAEVDQAYENAGSRIYRLIAEYTDE